MDLLQQPYFKAIEDLKASHPDANTSLVNIDLTSPLTLALKVSALAGPSCTAPIWLYQLWAFIVPGPVGQGEEVGADLHRRGHADVRRRRRRRRTS